MRKEITEDQITELMRAIPRAEEVERLRSNNDNLTLECDELRAEIERLRAGLHRVSLASQNSMASKDECGRIARETLEVKS